MKNYQESITRLHKNLCHARDPEIRRKGEMLLQAMRRGNFRKVAISHGVSRKVLYDWLRKLTAAGYDVQAVKNKSRRPKNSPNKTPDNIEELVVKIAKEFENSDIIMAERLRREHNHTLSHSTVCNILRRRKITSPRIFLIYNHI